MFPRMTDYLKKGQGAIKALYALEAAIKESGLDPVVVHLVKLRASQVNGCAYCIQMHAEDALASGEAPMRVFLLDAWREATVYSGRERAALAWTEALTNLAQTGAPDEDYALVEAAFDETERVNLTLAIGAINAWNRLQVGFRAVYPAKAGSHAA